VIDMEAILSDLTGRTMSESDAKRVSETSAEEWVHIRSVDGSNFFGKVYAESYGALALNPTYESTYAGDSSFEIHIEDGKSLGAIEFNLSNIVFCRAIKPPVVTRDGDRSTRMVITGTES
jgi:hypothetical protein